MSPQLREPGRRVAVLIRAGRAPRISGVEDYVGREPGHRGGERAVVPGHPRVAEVQSDERAHSCDEDREERSEQQRRGEERRVVDGELDLERQVDRPDLRKRR